MAEPFSLYVHVPWCRHVCPYCDFNVYASGSPPALAYVDALVAELQAHAGRAPWAGRRLASIYLGGGTPSLFSPDAVARFLDAAAGLVGVVPGAEVTLEANPGTLTVERCAAYRAAGVNRLSLGAQSFHAHHLRTLGRDHSARDTRAAVDAARAAGLDDLSLDLIFAVPGETRAEWEEDLVTAVALQPAHVSAYNLTYEVGTPFHAWRGRGRLIPVDEDTEAAMAETTLEMLEPAGWARYEISSFARPGHASRHNLAYWSGADYLGLGAGAHSFSAAPLPGRRWMNERQPERYMTAARTGGSAVASEERRSEGQARAEFCFCGLRQIAGVDTGAFRLRFGLDLSAAFPHVPALVADGLVEARGSRLRLTPRGLRFADAVSATFV